MSAVAAGVRTMREQDLETVDALLRAAFERPASFLDHVRLTRRLQPEGVFVAERDGQVVATVGAVDYGDLAYVGLMAVSPDMQSQGIGRMLMEHLLGWLRERNCPVVLLDATDRGAAMYESMRFVEDAAAYVYVLPEGVRTHAHATAKGASTLSTRRATAEDLDALVAFDAPRFGADRRKLLTTLLVDQRQPCLVAYDTAGQLQGYLFLRAVLGPWVAETDEIADVLLTAANAELAKQNSGAPPSVMVPRSNTLALELLKRHGFIEQRRLRHMRLGGACPPGRPVCLFGQSSFAHG
jgi:predicted N-acetyltransferase YhbS